ncbi:MAG: polysaccharide biosynthesis protein, partial [Oscillibacter sp.]
LNRALVGGHSAYGTNAVASLGGVCAGVAVYSVLVLALGLLRAEDVKTIPHGEKIVKILRLK